MAKDGRRNNGGNSTKAKGADRRKNPYREAIRGAFDADDVVNVLRKMYQQSVNDGDVQATKVFLEYTIGKPKEEISLSVDEGGLTVNLRDLLDFG